MADSSATSPPGQIVKRGDEDWWAVGIGLGIVIAALVLARLGLSLRWLAVLTPRWTSFGQITSDLAANYPRYLTQFMFWLAVFGGALSALGYRLRDFLGAFVPLYVAAYAIFVAGSGTRQSGISRTATDRAVSRSGCGQYGGRADAFCGGFARRIVCEDRHRPAGRHGPAYPDCAGRAGCGGPGGDRVDRDIWGDLYDRSARRP